MINQMNGRTYEAIIDEKCLDIVGEHPPLAPHDSNQVIRIWILLLLVLNWCSPSFKNSFKNFH
jgi:hypothetical protein